MFERDNQTGGRVRSAYVHDKRVFDVESDAGTFTEDDWCLKDAIRVVGLKQQKVVSHSRVAVWDGVDFLVSYDYAHGPRSSRWWTAPHWLWRYDSALPKLLRMVQSSAERFSKFAVFQPFLNLPKRLAVSSLHQETSASAASFPAYKSINAKLVKEVIRPWSRFEIAQDLQFESALSSLLALRSAPQSKI